MVFLTFHKYLAANVCLNIFFVGNYISILFTTWNDVSMYFLSSIVQVTLVFNNCGCVCYAKMKPKCFTFTVGKSFT